MSAGQVRTAPQVAAAGDAAAGICAIVPALVLAASNAPDETRSCLGWQEARSKQSRALVGDKELRRIGKLLHSLVCLPSWGKEQERELLESAVSACLELISAELPPPFFDLLHSKTGGLEAAKAKELQRAFVTICRERYHSPFLDDQSKGKVIRAVVAVLIGSMQEGKTMESFSLKLSRRGPLNNRESQSVILQVLLDSIVDSLESEPCRRAAARTVANQLPATTLLLFTAAARERCADSLLGSDALNGAMADSVAALLPSTPSTEASPIFVSSRTGRGESLSPPRRERGQTLSPPPQRVAWQPTPEAYREMYASRPFAWILRSRLAERLEAEALAGTAPPLAPALAAPLPTAARRRLLGWVADAVVGGLPDWEAVEEKAKQLLSESSTQFDDSPLASSEMTPKSSPEMRRSSKPLLDMSATPPIADEAEEEEAAALDELNSEISQLAVRLAEVTQERDELAQRLSKRASALQSAMRELRARGRTAEAQHLWSQAATAADSTTEAFSLKEKEKLPEESSQTATSVNDDDLDDESQACQSCGPLSPRLARTTKSIHEARERLDELRTLIKERGVQRTRLSNQLEQRGRTLQAALVDLRSQGRGEFRVESSKTLKVFKGSKAMQRVCQSAAILEREDGAIRELNRRFADVIRQRDHLLSRFEKRAEHFMNFLQDMRQQGRSIEASRLTQFAELWKEEVAVFKDAQRSFISGLTLGNDGTSASEVSEILQLVVAEVSRQIEELGRALQRRGDELRDKLCELRMAGRTSLRRAQTAGSSFSDLVTASCSVTSLSLQEGAAAAGRIRRKAALMASQTASNTVTRTRSRKRTPKKDAFLSIEERSSTWRPQLAFTSGGFPENNEEFEKDSWSRIHTLELSANLTMESFEAMDVAWKSQEVTAKDDRVEKNSTGRLRALSLDGLLGAVEEEGVWVSAPSQCASVAVVGEQAAKAQADTSACAPYPSGMQAAIVKADAKDCATTLPLIPGFYHVQAADAQTRAKSCASTPLVHKLCLEQAAGAQVEARACAAPSLAHQPWHSPVAPPDSSQPCQTALRKADADAVASSLVLHQLSRVQDDIAPRDSSQACQTAADAQVGANACAASTLVQQLGLVQPHSTAMGSNHPRQAVCAFGRKEDGDGGADTGACATSPLGNQLGRVQAASACADASASLPSTRAHQLGSVQAASAQADPSASLPSTDAQRLRGVQAQVPMLNLTALGEREGGDVSCDLEGPCATKTFDHFDILSPLIPMDMSIHTNDCTVETYSDGMSGTSSSFGGVELSPFAPRPPSTKRSVGGRIHTIRRHFTFDPGHRHGVDSLNSEAREVYEAGLSPGTIAVDT